MDINARCALVLTTCCGINHNSRACRAYGELVWLIYVPSPGVDEQRSSVAMSDEFRGSYKRFSPLAERRQRGFGMLNRIA